MAFGDIFKTLILPFIIAGTIYGLFAYIIIPFYRAHHARYANYAPLQSLSSRTTSLRARLQTSTLRWLLPSFLRWRHDPRSRSGQSYGNAWDGDSDEEFFGAEEGESMVGFDFERGRERLPVRGEDGRVVVEVELEIDSNRRLSRELEEGFKDDSESEDENGDGRRR